MTPLNKYLMRKTIIGGKIQEEQEEEEEEENRDPKIGRERTRKRFPSKEETLEDEEEVIRPLKELVLDNGSPKEIVPKDSARRSDRSRSPLGNNNSSKGEDAESTTSFDKGKKGQGIQMEKAQLFI